MRPLLSGPVSALLAALALSALRLPAALAATTLQNITVDDTDGSRSGGFQIVYGPPGVWSTGQNCTTCEANVDRNQALNGTWHDVSFISDNPPPAPISATLTFDGVAVYAFCIVTRSFSDPNGNWDLSFLIDGEHAGAFTLAPDGDASYMYNYPVYANASLTPGTHTFTMIVGHAGGQSSLALLDYMMFTQEVESKATPSSASPSPSLPGTSSTPGASSPSPSSSNSAAPAGAASTHRSSNTTTIALSVSLSVGPVLLISAFIYFLIRRRSNQLGTSTSRADSSTLDGAGVKEDGEGGSPSSAGFRDLPIFPRSASSVHLSRVAHPFIVPPPSPPAVSQSNATSYTWLPEAGAYVAVKGSVPSSASGTGTGAGTGVTGHLDAELPPIPHPPQDAQGVSSHEHSASEPYAAPAGRNVQRYVQNDDGTSAAGGCALSPVSLGASKMQLETSPVVGVPHASAVEVGPPHVGPRLEPATGSEFGADDDRPPPYAPRAP